MRLSLPIRHFFTGGAPEYVRYESGWESPAARRMFWTALGVRLLYMTLAHTYHIRPAQDHFQFGWEMGRIARALVTGNGYADPFAGHTGPTAWAPPLYPFILALAFKIFGVYTPAAAWFILALNSLASAAVAPALYELAQRCFGTGADGRGIALWSGWLWALYPAAMQYAVRWPWEMALTTLLFTWVLAIGLRLGGIGSPGASRSKLTFCLFGLLWGLIALCNSSLLVFLPIQAFWILWSQRSALRMIAIPAALSTGIFCACLAPWVIRNDRTFHAFVPMRGNFGAELYMTALPAHDGYPWGPTLPISNDDPELRRYARMGELAYSRSQGARGWTLIQANRQRFLAHVLLRVQFYWAGVPHPYDHGPLYEFLRQLDYAFLSVSGLLGVALALKRRVPGAAILAAAFASVPAVYYLITVQPRFRAPLEPLIALFAVYLFRSAEPVRRQPSVRQRHKEQGA